MEASDAGATPSPRPAAAVSEADARLPPLRWLIGVVDRLRDPDGCPWDKKQTELSLGPHLIEEAHEYLEAVESAQVDAAAEELGDVLMNVVLICRIAMDAGRYDLGRVAQHVADKLVRRHPHVFGEQAAHSPEEALASWESVKRAERAQSTDTSALAGVPRGLPALQRAGRICDKAIAAGFRWESPLGALAKVREELAELEAALGPAIARDPALNLSEAEGRAVAHELGDLMLASAHLARYLNQDPEALAREAVRRFETRYRKMEGELEGKLSAHPLPQLLQAWARAK